MSPGPGRHNWENESVIGTRTNEGYFKMKKQKTGDIMNTDSVIIICGTILLILNYGDPDLMDAIIHFLMR